jgi:hypothetical protein
MWNRPAGNFDGCAAALKAPWSAITLERRPRILPSADSAISPDMW